MSDLTSGPNTDMTKTALGEAAKTVIAVTGSVWASLTLNNLVALATLVFIVLQAVYLLWKWRREAGRRA